MSKVYIVHCIDTEGPLYESLEATFERLEHIYHIKLEPSQETLKKLQNGEINLNGKEKAVQKMLDPELLKYNETWDDIKKMLDICMVKGFRDVLPDSNGNGWVYNFFCVDFVNFENNPRRRCMGYHNIFDFYRNYPLLSKRDLIQFHYHPHPIINDAHKCATNWFHTNSLEQILCRRIIDREWFPSVNRPGFQVNRDDSHWFLEQYIPFDYSNMAVKSTKEDEIQHDFSGGRSGDWRRAPKSWIPYHPSHDDYQTYGKCRRYIARCLNVGTRSYLLTQEDVNYAFLQAKFAGSSILSFTNHDFRDIKKDICDVRKMIKIAKQRFPDVEFEYTDALTAMQNVTLSLPGLKCEFKTTWDGNTLNIKTKNRTFGPQPYLAIKTVTGQYFHDNFDYQKPFYEWSYTFDEETLPLKAIEKIGIAANNRAGETTVKILTNIMEIQ